MVELSHQKRCRDVYIQLDELLDTVSSCGRERVSELNRCGSCHRYPRVVWPDKACNARTPCRIPCSLDELSDTAQHERSVHTGIGTMPALDFCVLAACEHLQLHTYGSITHSGGPRQARTACRGAGCAQRAQPNDAGVDGRHFRAPLACHTPYSLHCRAQRCRGMSDWRTSTPSVLSSVP